MRRRLLLKLCGVFGIAAVAHLNDDVAKFTTGKALSVAIAASDGLIGPRISTRLMQKCISQDTSPFTRVDLAEVDPDLPYIIDRATIAEVRRTLDPENNSALRAARDRLEQSGVDELLTDGDVQNREGIESIRYWHVRAVDDAHRFATMNARNAQVALEGGNASILIDTLSAESFVPSIGIEAPFDEDSIDFERGRMGQSAMIADFSRAMGSFSVNCEGGSCEINDYFGFDMAPSPFDLDPIQSNIGRIFEGVEFASRGHLDEAARRIGQIFCHEGPNEQPSATSIPISISIDLAQG